MNEELIDMENAIVVGAIFIIFGLVLDGTPSHVVQDIVNLKNESKTKRESFDFICSTIGAIFIILGFLVAFGVVK